jgi:hypothetical protein
MFRYLGTKSQFKDLLVQSIYGLKFKRFADLTAGGCSIPYLVLSWDFSISLVTNDVNYYSYVISKALFEKNKSNIQDISKTKPSKGFLYRECQNNPDIFGPWIPETASIIDGLINRFANDPIYIGAIGSFLDSKDLRFRNVCGKYLRKALLNISPNDALARVQANAKTILKENLRLPPEKYTPYNETYQTCAQKLGNFNDTLASIDLIYPPDPSQDWGSMKDNDDIYKFYAITLSSILKQQKLDPTPDMVFSEKDVFQLFNFIFSHGGKYIMMWMQFSSSETIESALDRVVPTIIKTFHIKSVKIKQRPTGRTNESVIIWTK